MPAQLQTIPAELISAQQPLCLAEDTPIKVSQAGSLPSELNPEEWEPGKV